MRRFEAFDTVFVQQQNPVIKSKFLPVKFDPLSKLIAKNNTCHSGIESILT